METEKLDLNKMQRLLDGLNDGYSNINYDRNIDTEINITNKKDSISNIFKSFKIKNDPSNINIDFADLNMALNIDGRVGGYANITDVKYLYDDIIQNISSRDLVNAQYIICIYFINPNISMFGITDIMENLHDLYGDADILFGTYITEHLKENEIGYRILMTGIQDDKMEQLSKDEDLDLRYHKQLYSENHQLKNKVDELQNKIKRLEAQKDRLETSLLSLNTKY